VDCCCNEFDDADRRCRRFRLDCCFPALAPCLIFVVVQGQAKEAPEDFDEGATVVVERVTDLRPGTDDGSYSDSLVTFGNGTFLLFVADDGDSSRKLWAMEDDATRTVSRLQTAGSYAQTPLLRPPLTPTATASNGTGGIEGLMTAWSFSPPTMSTRG